MKNMRNIWLAMLLVAGSLSGVAQAALVLDTVAGMPNSSGPLVLDSSNFVAAKFSIGAGQSFINRIQAYVTSGSSGQSGDQFTIAVYSANGNNGLPGDNVWYGNATYHADGWNGLTNLNAGGLAPGNYWVAFEVGSCFQLDGCLGADSSHNTSGLLLPTFSSNGAVPALGYAFNSGAGYQAMTSNFGVRVSAVPELDTAWMFGIGLLSVLFRARSKAGNA